ncbi:hypothetical protein PRK78_004246 [Emydomyces testavorans]|uniref:Uncharacterized protein n=1 Tax=Emydomyces testavorans TaxID=2070801 RepID=A0AAF0DIF8_9EURO|nr:hypothetical protein PRK78_004246 [Emydomyces testavorans]
MAAPGGAPSPGPRSGSIGPNNPLPTPTQQPPMSSAPPASGAPAATGSSPAVMSQQNLNQINEPEIRDIPRHGMLPLYHF